MHNLERRYQLENKAKNNPIPIEKKSHITLSKRKATNVKKMLIRLWSYLSEEKLKLSLVFCSIFVTSALIIAGPYIMKIAIDECIAADVINFRKLAELLALMVAIYIGASATTFLQQWIMVGISQRAMKRLRKDLFHVYQYLSVKYFDTHATGELMSRVTNDIDNVSSAISMSVLEAITSVLTIIVVAIVMLVINIKLALICLVIVPLVIFITEFISAKARKSFRDRQKNIGELNSIIEESITGSRVIKVFTKEAEFCERFSDKNKNVQKSTNLSNIMSGVMGPLMNSMNNLSFTFTAVVGGLMAIGGSISVGTIAAFLSYSRQFSRPLNQVAQLFTSIQSAIAGAERVFTIMDEPLEEDFGKDVIMTDKVTGKVIFSNVHFSYQKGISILKGINIDAEPGKSIALVGSTGAGKTTIINLLTRFYDLDSGCITIDGKDIRNIPKSNLRNILGIVLQDTFLFSGTVKDNIRYGCPEASDEEIQKAAQMANAHQFIRRMPKGYETIISGNGSDLSHGQRQLIAITRTILSNPSILILDEATSSVDSLTEQNIQKGMLTLMKGRTSFVIAHRLSTIRNTDTILVMSNGEIIEQGCHEDLIQKKAAYYKLYTSQVL